MKIHEHVALITGGSSGIGRATAIALAASGSRVAINFLDDPGPAEVLAQMIRDQGGNAIAVQGDVTDPKQVARMFDLVEGSLGHARVIVACAGSSMRRNLLETTDEQLSWTFRNQVIGTFNVFQEGARRLIFKNYAGSFLTIGSVHATIPFPNAVAYNVAKAALHQLARTAAAELLPFGIRVNVLVPGLTDTPGERQFRTEAELIRAAELLPMNRMAAPEEVGRLAAYLVSDENRYMTGSTVTADGGIEVSLELPGIVSNPGG